MILGDGVTSASLEQVKAITETIDGPEKYLSFHMGGMGKNEGYNIYVKLMQDYLLQELDLLLPDLVKKWSEQCWTCGKIEACLKTCSICKWAKYCGKTCQAKGRQLDKLLDDYMKKYAQLNEHIVSSDTKGMTNMLLDMLINKCKN